MAETPVANGETPFLQAYWREPVSTAATLPPLDADRLGDGEFRLLAETLPALCWIARGDGYIVWYNRRWHAYCGSTPESMEGWGWQDVHDPELLPGVMARWVESVATGEPFEMVFPLRGADGVFRPFLTRICPLRDATGAVVRWFGTNTEIGAQQRAEGAYRVLTEALPHMVWSTLPDGRHILYNDRWYDFTGLVPGTGGAGRAAIVHADDWARARARWRHALDTGEPFEVEYRLRHRSGAYRWALGRAMPVSDDRGRITRWIGTCTDIHAAKLASEHNELLTRELSHRIKNIFAIITGLVRLSARRDPNAKGFAHALTSRIAALGRAHEFARPHSDGSRPQSPEMMLQGMLRELFLPYSEAGEERVLVAGDDVPVDDRGATPIALLFHELATNAAKYGALLVPEGRVDLTVACRGEVVTLVWQEFGGPAIMGEPTTQGFGTQLAAMSVEQQLGGALVRAWHPAGLKATITLDRTRLARS